MAKTITQYPTSSGGVTFSYDYTQTVGPYETWYDFTLPDTRNFILGQFSTASVHMKPWTAGDHAGGDVSIAAQSAFSDSGANEAGGIMTVRGGDGAGGWGGGGTLELIAGGGQIPGNVVIDPGASAPGPAGAVLAFSDAGAGNVTATLATPHGFPGLQLFVNISDSTHYDGIREVYISGPSEFWFVHHWDGDAGGGTYTPEYILGNIAIGSNADNIAIGAAASKLGFYGGTPQPQITGNTTLTNSVTAGGVDGTIADFADLTTYSNSAAAIRNDIYQLAKRLKILTDALAALGLVVP
jgi:hypothetical protein